MTTEHDDPRSTSPVTPLLDAHLPFQIKKPTVFDTFEKDTIKAGKVLHDQKLVYGIYGALDGLSCSFTMLKWLFDVLYANSAASSADMFHDFILTPEGIALLAIGAPAMICVAVIANYYEKKDNPTLISKAYKDAILGYWPYVRDAMKALKNGYRGVRNVVSLMNLLILTQCINQWITYLFMPIGLVLGLLSMNNRMWLRWMRDERKAQEKINAQLLTRVEAKRIALHVLFESPRAEDKKLDPVYSYSYVLSISPEEEGKPSKKTLYYVDGKGCFIPVSVDDETIEQLTGRINDQNLERFTGSQLLDVLAASDEDCTYVLNNHYESGRGLVTLATLQSDDASIGVSNGWERDFYLFVQNFVEGNEAGKPAFFYVTKTGERQRIALSNIETFQTNLTRTLTDKKHQYLALNIENKEFLNEKIPEKNQLGTPSDDWRALCSEVEGVFTAQDKAREANWLAPRAYLAELYNALLDSPYLYLGAVTLTALSPSFFILVASLSLFYMVSCIVCRLFDEYEAQCHFKASQAEVRLACCKREVELLFDELAKLSVADAASLNKHEPDALLMKQLLVFDRMEKMMLEADRYRLIMDEQLKPSLGFALLNGVRNGLALYGVIASIMFLMVTINLLFSMTYSPLLLLGFVSFGLVCVLGFVAEAWVRYETLGQSAQIVPREQNIKTMVEEIKQLVQQNPVTLAELEESKKTMFSHLVTDPSPQFFFQDLFECARLFFSGVGKGCRNVDTMCTATQERGDDGHFHSSSDIAIPAIVAGVATAGIFAARGVARLGCKEEEAQFKTPLPLTGEFFKKNKMNQKTAVSESSDNLVIDSRNGAQTPGWAPGASSPLKRNYSSSFNAIPKSTSHDTVQGLTRDHCTF